MGVSNQGRANAVIAEIHQCIKLIDISDTGKYRHQLGPAGDAALPFRHKIMDMSI
jgi:hypothetical protein